MTRSVWLALAGLAMISASAAAAPAVQRVRGTIETAAADSLTVKQADGQDVRIALGADTKYASVVASSLSDIKPGDFIGTATKGPADFLVALELVIFPESMRGMGEGQYPWDTLPDTTMSAGGPKVGSTMTNGNVTAAAPATGTAQTPTTMTNGSVATGAASSAGDQITVSYSGKSSKILVPPTATIVRFVPSDRAVAAVGSKVFVVAKEDAGKLDAAFVAAGRDGVTPPM